MPNLFINEPLESGCRPFEPFAMTEPVLDPPLRLTNLSHGGGCGCKIAPAVLERILADTPFAKGLAAGFPDLTNPAWAKVNGSEATIIQAIMQGRKGGMPAFQARLGDAKIQLLTAYVWGLGGGVKPAAPAPAAAMAPAAATPETGAAPAQ